MFKWSLARIRAVEILINISFIVYLMLERVCVTFTLNCRFGFIVENISRGHYGNKMDTFKS